MGARAEIIRMEIEAKLADRIPSALTQMEQQAPRLHPTGNVHLDRLLNGGLPMGTICEATGQDGSGRSSIALSLLALATRQGACAYIDVSDSLSPHSAAAAGVLLSNLLWVRFAATVRTAPSAPAPAAAPPLPVHSQRQRESVRHGGGSHHPRGETKGVAPALEQMLFYKDERRRRKMEGTPGYPNRPFGLASASQEQVDWERFNTRVVDEADPLRQLDQASAKAARLRATVQAAPRLGAELDKKPWNRLDCALRATDQVLQSGGFRVVVLDLASLDAQQAGRISSATWWRFQKCAQQGDCILLLLTKEPCARSSAACVLECSVGGPLTVQGVLSVAVQAAGVARQRTVPAFGRKAPGRAASWDAHPSWMQAVGG